MHKIQFSIGKPSLSSAIWAGFILIFLLAGVIGHDPWKQDETYSFGIIYHFLTTGSWLIPENAGTPFMEKPPLYYWSAVILCKLMGGLIPLPDCARLASFLYILIAMAFVRKIILMLYKDKYVVQEGLLLCLGSIGIARHCHDMFTDIALLTGCAIVLYAMILLACRNECWKSAGIWLGIGMGMAFLSKGLFMPIVLTIGGVVLLIMRAELRTRATARAVGISLLVAAPFLFVWPVLLYQHSPALFMQWFWENNIGRFLGFSVAKLGAANKPYFIISSVLWFAFPVFPLAVLAIWRARREWKKPELLLPLAISVAGLILLSFSASARSLYLMPLIPAFAILAVRGLQSVPDRFLRGWNKLIGLVGVLAVLVLWLIWFSLLPGHRLPQILPYVGTVFPLDFEPQRTQWLAMAVSVFAAWFFLHILRNSKSAPAIWFSAIAAAWITANTLLLPWIDETKSYRPVIAQLDEFIRHSDYKDVCMSEYFLGESIAPMLEYFDKEHTLAIVNSFDAATCPLMLTVTGRNDPKEPYAGWKLLWKGSRALDAKDEELRLYARNQ